MISFEQIIDILWQQHKQKVKLLDIAKRLSSHINLDDLLGIIVKEAASLLGADRGSLFLYDEDTGELWSKIAQGIDYSEIRVSAREGIIGYCFTNSKVVNIKDAYSDSRFNPEVDHKSGYKTKTILAMPVKNRLNETIGVIEVLNKYKGYFTKDDEELLSAFCSLAGISIESAYHHKKLNNLFESFISLASAAIDARDPSTAGHSKRVAKYSYALAKEVNKIRYGNLKNIYFPRNALRQIYFGGLLHDFGKIGVKEAILTKSMRINTDRLKALEWKVRFLLSNISDSSLFKKVSSFISFVKKINQKDVLSKADIQRLDGYREVKVRIDGRVFKLLDNDDYNALKVQYGNLTDNERKELMHHPQKSFDIISKLDWTNELKDIPEIIYQHHEKLDGSGYPRGLKNGEIRIEAQILAIADIYDALKASDRPYKKSIDKKKIRQIMMRMAKEGKLNKDLVRVFFQRVVGNE